MSTDIRWFVVLPPVGSARIDALRIAKAIQQEFGGGSYVYDSKDSLAYIQSTLRNSEQSLLVDWMNQNMIVKILEQGATHLVSLSTCPVDPYYLNLIRSKGVFCLHWILDDVRVADYWHAVIHGYDLVVANQKGEIPRECLQKKVSFQFLPLAADVAVSGAGAMWDARSLDIAFLGDWSPYRVRMLEMLSAAGLSVGIQGDGWAKERGFLARSVLKATESSEMDLYRHARIALHLSHGQPPESGSEEPIHANVYNSIALGALPFIEASKLNSISLSGIGYQEFHSNTELLAKCLHVRQMGLQSEFILANQQAIQREHNLNHRVRQLAQKMP